MENVIHMGSVPIIHKVAAFHIGSVLIIHKVAVIRTMAGSIRSNNPQRYAICTDLHADNSRCDAIGREAAPRRIPNTYILGEQQNPKKCII